MQAYEVGDCIHRIKVYSLFLPDDDVDKLKLTAGKQSLHSRVPQKNINNTTHVDNGMS